MEIYIDGKRSFVKETTVREVLKELGFNPEIFLVKRNNEIIHENEFLEEGDSIRLIKVISGG